MEDEDIVGWIGDSRNVIMDGSGDLLSPEDVDLEQVLAKELKMGNGAPTVKVVVGKNHGQITDGTPKPICAMLWELILISNCPNL